MRRSKSCGLQEGKNGGLCAYIPVSADRDESTKAAAAAAGCFCLLLLGRPKLRCGGIQSDPITRP